MTHFQLLLLNQDKTDRECGPNKLKDLCINHYITLFQDPVETESLSRTLSGTYFLIGGSPSAVQLRQACDLILSSWRHVIIVVNALDNYEELRPLLGELTELGQIQKTVLDALPALFACKHLKIYAFEKADSTCTIAVLLNSRTWWERKKIAICAGLRRRKSLGTFEQWLLNCLDDARALVIVRLRDPYKDTSSFPGGFLDVFIEDIAQTASRELMEECHLAVDPSELTLIDVRSEVYRDQRGHVIDHGFAWFVPPCKHRKVLTTVKAGDDAKAGSARFVSVSELLTHQLAFDHSTLLKRAIEHNSPFRPAS
jgi:ADP-ribose pyrophosphatase YjhB (NUDIX family)